MTVIHAEHRFQERRETIKKEIVMDEMPVTELLQLTRDLLQYGDLNGFTKQDLPLIGQEIHNKILGRG
tara:strand:+ start:367 stop:570 length:204 start_codon:yes stop_codon:yes gene_type:complete